MMNPRRATMAVSIAAGMSLLNLGKLTMLPALPRGDSYQHGKPKRSHLTWCGRRHKTKQVLKRRALRKQRKRQKQHLLA